MKKRLLGLLAATAITTAGITAASAADLPAAPPPYIAPVPIFTWTGFYVGGNLGWGWRDSNDEPVILTGPGVPGGLEGGILRFDNGNDATFTGGGQIGYNYQIGSWVIGAEADIQGIDTDRQRMRCSSQARALLAGTLCPASSRKVRIGGARCACAPVSPSTASWSTPPVVWPTRRTTPAGRLGGGVEWAMPVNWFGSSAVTLGLEGLWVSIDQDDDDINRPIGTFTPVAGAPVNVFLPRSNDEQDFFVARAKLNFKFGTY